MPELNFDNPVVRQEMVALAKAYLDMGVDGFRFDAAKYVYYGDEAKNAEFWDWYMAELRAIKPDIYSVAEVWDADTATFPYFSSTNCFNFTMSQQSGLIAKAAKGGSVGQLTNYMEQYLEQIKAKNPDAMPVTFITNHDMDRAAGFLQPGFGHAQMAANLSILLPGSSFIYYGEEIGMLGSRGGSSTDANRRLAMLWGDGDTVKNPVGANYSSKQGNGTVKDQLSDPNSLYNHYKKLIALRKANPEIANGVYTSLSLKEGKVGGFLSEYEGKIVAVLHNTTTETVTIDLSKYPQIPAQLVAGFAGLGNATLEGNLLTLAGQTSVILR
jgi:glycosidase